MGDGQRLPATEGMGAQPPFRWSWRNVSARQFHQPDFVESVQRCLQQSGANPARLKLELTESIVLENLDMVVERMQQLGALGIRFAG
jgi:EAL domain-containing protein (putative c-di-GMP-specific phosphodiesterase class I)